MCIGGSIIDSRTSPTYNSGSTFVTVYGLQLWSVVNPPRTVIQVHSSHQNDETRFYLTFVFDSQVRFPVSAGLSQGTMAA